MIDCVAEGVFTVSAELTVKRTAFEVTVTGDPELSVTLSSKDQVPTVFKVPVEADAGEVHGEELPRTL
jgi:hypothetical protein